MSKLLDRFTGGKQGKASPSSPEGKQHRNRSYQPDRVATNQQAAYIASTEGLTAAEKRVFHDLLQSEKGYGGIVPEKRLKELASQAKKK